MKKVMTRQIAIMRYNPEKDRSPHRQTYHIPFDETTSLLDAFSYIKDNLSPDFTYRSSCRMAICGSCGVMANNIPVLACKTFLRDYPQGVTIEALANFPIEKDLVVDMSHFIKSIEAIKPYIINQKSVPHSKTTYHKQTPAQLLKYQQFSMCINCGLCYAACPQFGLNPEFIGPAAITLAHRYNLDNRDQGYNERKTLLNSENGVWRCTFVGYCSTVCPKKVDPAAAIQQSKIDSAKDYLIAKLKL